MYQIIESKAITKVYIIIFWEKNMSHNSKAWQSNLAIIIFYKMMLQQPKYLNFQVKRK